MVKIWTISDDLYYSFYQTLNSKERKKERKEKKKRKFPLPTHLNIKDLLHDPAKLIRGFEDCFFGIVSPAKETQG